MSKFLYMEDCYLKEFDAKVIAVEGKIIELDQTAFYPESGGQPTDLGILESNGASYNIVKVRKDKGRIVHEVDKEGLGAGDEVHGKLDWERRHTLMRYHTGSHILSDLLSMMLLQKMDEVLGGLLNLVSCWLHDQIFRIYQGIFLRHDFFFRM